jgi:hypothetical protein
LRIAPSQFTNACPDVAPENRLVLKNDALVLGLACQVLFGKFKGLLELSISAKCVQCF